MSQADREMIEQINRETQRLIEETRAIWEKTSKIIEERT